MSIELIHRFTTNTQWCYDTCLIQEPQEKILGVLSHVQLGDEEQGIHYVIELTLIDLRERRCEYVVTYKCTGPTERELTQDALLRYDFAHHRWVIAQLQDGWYTYVGMRTLKVSKDGSPILSPLCLLEQGFSIGGINPLLALDIREDTYRFLYHRRFVDHLWDPRIGKTDVRVWEAWDSLEEQMATVRGGDTSGPANWREWLHVIEQQASTHRKIDRIFLPEQVIFDPRSMHASQTSDIEIISQGEVMEAEMALTMTDGATRLFAFCSPEIRPDADLSEEELAILSTLPLPSWYVKLPIPESAKKVSPQWHIWLTGWNRDDLSYQWVYTPEIGVPLEENRPFDDDPPRPAAYVAALAGPETASQQQTLVAVVAFSQLEKDVYVSRKREDKIGSEEEENGEEGTRIPENDEEGDGGEGAHISENDEEGDGEDVAHISENDKEEEGEEGAYISENDEEEEGEEGAHLSENDEEEEGEEAAYISENDEEENEGESITEDEDEDDEDEEEYYDDDDDEIIEVTLGKPYGPIQSHAVCLTHDGQVLQEVTEPFGLRPSLCRCREWIVGVDQSPEGWRLWNWSALHESHLNTLLMLDSTCQHVFVRAEPESSLFWLIEEIPEGVRVSRRDAVTLAVVTDSGFLAGARLVVESREQGYSLRERTLDPQRPPGLLPYQETLLLLVLNEQGEMELYQVR